MVPVQAFVLEHYVGEDGEHYEGDTLLNHLELNEREGPSVASEADAVGWYLTAIFEEGDEP